MKKAGTWLRHDVGHVIDILFPSQTLDNAHADKPVSV